MAAAATGLLSAAARLCTRSASTIGRRAVTDSHSLTIDGYATSRKIPIHWFSRSQPFDAVGHRWRIRYHPNAPGWVDGHISLYLEVEVDSFYGVYRITDPVDFRFTLLDHGGSPVYSRGVEGHVFCEASRGKGFEEFIWWKDLARSGCLKDDSFTVRCDITVFEDWAEDDNGGGADDATPVSPPVAHVVVPPSDLREHLYNLLWKKQGTDVVIDVAGESFDAHEWLLMARSPAVFEPELLAVTATKEKLPSGSGRRRVVIKDMEPKVFKAMLHYMYTDALPLMEEEEEEVAMAQGLIAAADRFKIERLKLMCEEMLCRRIDVDTVAVSLAVAEDHGCHALKATCLEFVATPGNMKAAMETEGFEKVKDKCLPLMLDVIIKKQLA
ncbi:unnamed protein product [Urochloa decumbens]|uniref:Uncharacterized protein n=1 Tax=Urochloa decumbens TaxID=240449 RepID=A0ABC8VY30_9POAL